MPGPVTSPATYEDLVKVPDHLVAEIVDGELFTSPRPASRHGRAASGLGGKLVPPFDHGEGGPGGWWIIFEPEIHLDRDILVPDLAGWRRERMPEYPDVAFFELAPDWVCEVISPSSAKLDRVMKVPKYATYGVRNLWLIDPSARTLEVYRQENSHWLLLATHGGDAAVRAEPFDAIELALQPLWI
ncbi:MAG TPA: Uma2 family endonuclease [Thermoanaerobaculia bacterium]|nr:Uma2 family endonuclease [Thermoanaerobaculia bacterium]